MRDRLKDNAWDLTKSLVLLQVLRRLRDKGHVLLAAGPDKIVKEESKMNSKLDQVRIESTMFCSG